MFVVIEAELLILIYILEVGLASHQTRFSPPFFLLKCPRPSKEYISCNHIVRFFVCWHCFCSVRSFYCSFYSGCWYIKFVLWPGFFSQSNRLWKSGILLLHLFIAGRRVYVHVNVAVFFCHFWSFSCVSQVCYCLK